MIKRIVEGMWLTMLLVLLWGPAQSFAKTTPTVTLTVNPAQVTLGNNLAFTATVVGNSPTGTVTFTVNSSTVGTVNLGSATLNGSGVAVFNYTSSYVGQYTATASYGGDSNNSSVTSAGVPIAVVNSQTISFTAPANTTYWAAPFTLSATASSGLTVAFSSSTPSVCTVSGSTVTLVSTGTCTIAANQAGNSSYAAAPQVTQSFTVAGGTPPITLTVSPSQVTLGNNLAFTATVVGNNPTGAVTFTVSSSAVGTVNLGSATLNGSGVAVFNYTSSYVGQYTATASYGGDSHNAAVTSSGVPIAVVNSQTISFTAPANTTYGAAPFALSATASSGLTVAFSSSTPSVCTVSGSTVTLIGAGTCSIAANQAGNSSYAAAPQVTQSFTVSSSAQTITFSALSGMTYGTPPFTVSATASSGLAVAFTSTTTAICTISGSTVTLVGAGTCTINANQAGNANYNAAAQITQSFTVAQESQSITFNALSSQTYGTAPFTISATSSAGLPVTFSSSTASVCTVSSSTVTLVADGTCTIAANQAGNTNVSVATQVVQSFAVVGGSQTITFAALGNQSYGTAPFTVSATASSGLTVTFTSATTSICTVSGSTVTLLSAGTCTIDANQAGNANYAAATQIAQSFTVTQESQSITFGALSSQAYGTAPFSISATSSAGLAVTFSSSTTSVCTVSGSTVTLVGGGTCTIAANQAGNTNISAAMQVTQSFTVTGGKTVTLTVSPTQVILGNNLTFTATVVGNNPTGTVTFTVSSSAVGTVNLGSATLNGSGVAVFNYTSSYVGQYTATASYGGDSHNAALTSVGVPIAVVNSQTISFTAPANTTYGAAPFALSATASSGLTVAFSSSTLSVCTVSGSTVTLIGAGTCSIAANQAGNSSYAAAPQVTQSFAVSSGTQTITFAALSGMTYGASPFTVSATASSGLTVAFTSATTAVCTVSGSTVTLVGAGTCTINANQAGNANYSAATQVAQSFTVAKENQTITFGALSTQAYGSTPFTVSATSNAGLAIAFSSSTTSICTVSGSTISLVSAGTCTIAANQSGNINVNAAAQVTQSFNVTGGNQTITFATLNNQSYGTAPFTVSATASSGLAVMFSSSTTPVCTVSGSTVTLLSVGTCTIDANQSGNANYTAAAQVAQSFTVTQESQSITFGALSGQTFGASPFTISATSSAGLAVTFSSNTTSVCTVSGATVTIVSGGTCTIVANQAGTANISAATPVAESFTVAGSSQVITFSALSAQIYGATPFTVSATASSGLAVAFSSSTTSVCTVSGATVTLVGVGTCTITANQAGNANIAAAAPVAQSFTISTASQTITFTALSNQVMGTAPFGISASSSAGLTVSFSSSTTSVCTVSGATVTLAGTGTCTITANQAGNTNIAAATPVAQSFTVTAANQTITFIALSNQTLGATPFTVTATASSGLAVSFTSSTTSICTVSGATVTLVSAGTCTLAANQAGNSSYAAATQVTQSFTVAAPLSVTLTSPVSGQSIGASSTLTLTATATDSAGSITQVTFYNGTALMGTVTQPPYSIAIPNIAAGTYNITAQVTDSLGFTATSSPVAITVSSGWVQGAWVSQSVPTNRSWNSVAYGNGIFVMAGEHSGRSVYSADGGVTWTQIDMFRSDYWLPIAYGGGQFVTLSNVNYIAAVSPDGINWTQQTLPASASWDALAYGNGIFVALAQNSNIAATSPDGMSWTQQTLPANTAWSGITYGNGRFVAVALNTNIAATSVDGVNWVQQTLPVSAAWVPITYGNGKFVALTTNSAVMATSPDGANWTQSAMPQSAQWSGVAYGDGMFVAVAGYNFSNDNPVAGTIAATSPDGINWTSSTMPTSDPWSAIVYGNNEFLAIATGPAVNNSNASDAATLSMTESSLPTVTLNSSILSQNWMAPANIALGATASSVIGQITQVQFFNGTTLLGTSTQAPFTYNWNNVPAGTYSISAVATDVAGFTGTSATSSIHVESPLTVSIVNPVSGSQLANGNIVLSVNVSEPGGTISQVAYYNGAALLGTSTQAPFNLDLKDLTAGSYAITAQATDSEGFTVTSAPVSVTVVAGATATGGGTNGTGTTEVIYDIHTDQINTPRQITDQNGNVVWQWDNTDPFGDNLPNANSNQFVFNQRFAGQYYDIETGLFHNGFRDYEPTTGRYIESDPFGLYGAQFSTYAYVFGNPNSYVDVFGLYFAFPDNPSIENIASFFQAIGYLQQDPSMAKIIEQLATSNDPLNIHFSSAENNEWVPTEGIYWNSKNALCVKDNDGNLTGAVQSPALGLGHEMSHAARPWYKYILAKIPAGDYGNEEEESVITGPEADAARTLGEGTRTNHSGGSSRVSSSTSTKCDCKNAH